MGKAKDKVGCRLPRVYPLSSRFCSLGGQVGGLQDFPFAWHPSYNIRKKEFLRSPSLYGTMERDRVRLVCPLGPSVITCFDRRSRTCHCCINNYCHFFFYIDTIRWLETRPQFSRICSSNALYIVCNSMSAWMLLLLLLFLGHSSTVGLLFVIYLLTSVTQIYMKRCKFDKRKIIKQKIWLDFISSDEKTARSCSSCMQSWKSNHSAKLKQDLPAFWMLCLMPPDVTLKGWRVCSVSAAWPLMSLCLWSENRRSAFDVNLILSHINIWLVVIRWSAHLWTRALVKGKQIRSRDSQVGHRAYKDRDYGKIFSLRGPYYSVKRNAGRSLLVLKSI